MTAHEMTDFDARHFAVEKLSEIEAEMIRSVELPAEHRIIYVGSVALQAPLLIEGKPGSGKTTAAEALATTVSGNYGLIEGTPDLTPGDITGVPIYNQKTGEFEFKPGPIFSNVVFVNEMNRMSPKAQSGLIRAMQQGQVIIPLEDKPRDLSKPFVVLADQNPEEKEQGTYPITDANTDRFAMSIKQKDVEVDDYDAIEAVDGYETKTVLEEVNELLVIKRGIESVAMDASTKGRAKDVISFLKDMQNEENGVGVDKDSLLFSSYRPYKEALRVAKLFALFRGEEKIASATARKEDMDRALLYTLPHRVAVSWEAETSGMTPELAVSYALQRAA